MWNPLAARALLCRGCCSLPVTLLTFLCNTMAFMIVLPELCLMYMPALHCHLHGSSAMAENTCKLLSGQVDTMLQSTRQQRQP